MKKNVVAASLFACFAACAAGVPPLPPLPPLVPQNVETFGQGLPLNEFLKITLGEAAKRDYVLLPDAANANVFISASVKNFKKDCVPLVREILESMGYVLRESQNTLIVEKRKETKSQQQDDTTEIAVYKPLYRPAGLLMGYLSMFPGVSSSVTGASMRSPVVGDTSAQSAVTGSGTQYKQPDNDPAYLVFKGDPRQLRAVEKLMKQLDTPQPEVLLRAYVFEVRDSQHKESSVQLVLNLLGGRINFTAGSAPTTGDVARLTLPNVSAAVSALTSDSRVKLVSSPVLRASDGATASAQIGTDTPTLGAIVTTNGAATQSVTYQSAGVILTLTPKILEKSVRLAISQEISSFVQTTTGITSSPTKLRRSFKSDVVADDNEVLLLGGLSEQSESSAKAKSFFFTGGQSNDVSSSDFVVMLQVQRL